MFMTWLIEFYKCKDIKTYKLISRYYVMSRVGYLSVIESFTAKISPKVSVSKYPCTETFGQTYGWKKNVEILERNCVE